LLGGQYPKVGYGIFMLGAVVSVVNMYTSYLRYPVHRVLGKSRDSYKHVSGFPLIGGLVLIGAWLLPQSLWLSLVTALLMLLDTGGVFSGLLLRFGLILFFGGRKMNNKSFVWDV